MKNLRIKLIILLSLLIPTSLLACSDSTNDMRKVTFFNDTIIFSDKAVKEI